MTKKELLEKRNLVDEQIKVLDKILETNTSAISSMNITNIDEAEEAILLERAIKEFEMKSIEEYILEVDNMKNISDGGSPAYSFGDVVLIKYSTLNEYGIARKDEELISRAANEKKIKEFYILRNVS